MPQITLPLISTRFLNADGSITDKFRKDFVEMANYYADTAEFLAGKIGKRPLENYAARQVHVVGSVLNGVNNSDIDILILADKIDWEDSRFFKLSLAQALFTNRSKYSAIDAYVQPEDDRPENKRWEVTNQLRHELGMLNQRLGYFRA